MRNRHLTLNLKNTTEGMNTSKTKKIFCAASVTFFVALGVSAYAQDMHTSSQFRGSHANQGHVTHSTRNGKSALMLSDDFCGSRIFIGGSAGLVVESGCKLGFKKAFLVRDPDGHAILVEEK